jgi:hypothetical protein
LVDIEASHSSFNDHLRSSRFGLETIEEGKSKFIYFFFEALILFFVVIHSFMEMLSGVWRKRESEIETIQQATSRIYSQERMRKTKDRESIVKVKAVDEIKSDRMFLDEELFHGSLIASKHKYKRIRRTYSDLDVLRFDEVEQELKHRYRSIADRYLYERHSYEYWRIIQKEFGYGGDKFEPLCDKDVINYKLKGKKRQKTFIDIYSDKEDDSEYSDSEIFDETHINELKPQ